MGWSVLLLGWAPRGCPLPSHLNPLTCLSFSPRLWNTAVRAGALGSPLFCADAWMGQLSNYSWVGIRYGASAHPEGYPLTPPQRLLVTGEYPGFELGEECPLSLEPSKFSLSFTQQKVLFKLSESHSNQKAKVKKQPPIFSPVLSYLNPSSAASP